MSSNPSPRASATTAAARRNGGTVFTGRQMGDLRARTRAGMRRYSFSRSRTARRGRKCRRPEVRRSAGRMTGKRSITSPRIGKMMAVAVTFTGAAPKLESPVALFQTHLASGTNVLGSKPQYDVARDGRFLLNTAVESGARDRRVAELDPVSGPLRDQETTNNR